MKATIISIIVAVVLIGGAFIFTRDGGDTGQVINANNVSVVDGKQIIEITARGGYQPRKSIAKAGIPTIIRFNTKGTFDCSSSVRIPSLDITKSLPQSGSTDIDIGSGKIGSLKGSCGMGMYPFEVEFQS
jgi:plastocyanin domain-containing protein